jgi:hypothetical protein
MALMVIFGGLGAVLVGIGGYFFPAVREAEGRLADHDAAPVAAETAGA